MKNLYPFLLVMFILDFILGCSMSKEPEWTKARVLVEKLESPSALTIDDKFIYFVTGGHLASLREGTSGVWKIPMGGGQPILLFKGYQKDENNVVLPDTFVLAVDDKYLYFAAGHIYRIPKAGGKGEQVTPGSPNEMVVDEENIYWHNFVVKGMPPTPVYSISKTGKGGKTLTESAIILDIALDNENFYWAQPDGIYKIPKNGGEKKIIIGPRNGGRINRMSTDRNSIYFLDNDVLFMIPKSGDSPVQITSGVNTVHKFMADDKNIYFVKNEGAFGTSLNKVSKNGGDVTKLDNGYLRSFTVGKEKIYVSDGSKIYELPK